MKVKIFTFLFVLFCLIQRTSASCAIKVTIGGLPNTAAEILGFKFTTNGDVAISGLADVTNQQTNLDGTATTWTLPNGDRATDTKFTLVDTGLTVYKCTITTPASTTLSATVDTSTSTPSTKSVVIACVERQKCNLGAMNTVCGAASPAYKWIDSTTRCATDTCAAGDKTTCCLQKCATAQCSASHVIKSGNNYCAGSTCVTTTSAVTTDQDACCDPKAKCTATNFSTNTCSGSLKLNENNYCSAATASTTVCDATSCCGQVCKDASTKITDAQCNTATTGNVFKADGVCAAATCTTVAPDLTYCCKAKPAATDSSSVAAFSVAFCACILAFQFMF